MIRRALFGAVLWITTVRSLRKAWEAQEEVDLDRWLAVIRDTA